MTKTDQQIAAWYNDRVEADPFNPPTVRDVATFMGVRSASTASLKLQVLEARGDIAGRRTRKVVR